MKAKVKILPFIIIPCQLFMVYNNSVVAARSTDSNEDIVLQHNNTNRNATNMNNGPRYERWGIRTEEATSSWSYANTGAWSLLYPTCGGTRQSPINIEAASLAAYPKFQFGNYGNVDGMVVTNNGHSVILSLPSGFSSQSVPYITGGGLPGQYTFVQVHFHWGSDSATGSEHLINSKRYPAEIHMIHYNAKYGSLTEATQYDDGLAVLSIFMEVENRDNSAFQAVVNQLGEVGVNGDETTLNNPFSLKDLLPSRTSSFYRYLGSLTTPACSEIVIWTVFDKPISVSENQLSKFRKLKGDHDELLVNNFRPYQSLNGRTITYRSYTGCQISRGWPLSSVPVIEAFQYCACLLSFYSKLFLDFIG